MSIKMAEGEIFLDDTIEQSIEQNEIDDDSEMDEDFDDFIESSGIVVHTSTLTQSNKRQKHSHQQVPKWSNDILIQSFSQSINQYKYMHKHQCPSWSDCQAVDVIIPTVEVPKSPKQSEQSNNQSIDQSTNQTDNIIDQDGIEFGEPLDTEASQSTPEHTQSNTSIEHMYPPGLSLPVDQSINQPVDQSNNQSTYPAPPAPANEQEALQGMLSSYYNTGFYAGYYQAMRQMSAASNSGTTS